MKDDGGPAFPMNTPEWHAQICEDGLRQPCDFTMGMSIRDYFAARAMEALMHLVSDNLHIPEKGCSPAGIASDAYEMADAMLKARDA